MCVCAYDRKCNNNHNLAWLSVFLPQSFNFHVTVWAKYILYLYFSYALLMIRNEFVENIASIAMMARVDSQTNLGESNLRHGNTDRKQIVISFSPNYNCKLVCETWISKLTFFFLLLSHMAFTLIYFVTDGVTHRHSPNLQQTYAVFDGFGNRMRNDQKSKRASSLGFLALEF